MDEATDGRRRTPRAGDLEALLSHETVELYIHSALVRRAEDALRRMNSSGEEFELQDVLCGAIDRGLTEGEQDEGLESDIFTGEVWRPDPWTWFEATANSNSERALGLAMACTMVVVIAAAVVLGIILA